MRHLFRLSFLALFCISFQLNAQDVARKVSDDAGHPKMVVFKKSASYTLNSPRQVLQDQLKISQDYQFLKTRSEADNIGFTHEKYQQYYQGIKVEFGIYTLHGRSGKVESMSGEFYEIGDLNLTPAISSKQAFQNALNHTKAQSYLWDDPEAASAADNYQKPEGELLILPMLNNKTRTTEHHLAYKFDIYATNPLSRGDLYIDAHSGEALFYNATIKHTTGFGHVGESAEAHKAHNKKLKAAIAVFADVPANGNSLYNGNVSFTADNASGPYRLRQAADGVETYDLNNGTNYNNASDVTSGGTNFTGVETGVQAHWGAEQTHDYFLSQHGRDSYNGSGAVIRSYVSYSSNYVNAFWDGSRMTYGDGDGVNYGPLVSVDIVGHEIGHGVTEFTANLVYSYESGALNESFSDIFGEAIENHATGTNDWQMGTDMGIGGSGAIRSMNNPNAYNDPDTYGGTNWHVAASDNGGVHINSGVQNKWFYILTVGESGTNDNGDSYNVTGIGMTAAAAIAYRNLSVYLSVNSQYADARNGAIQSAIDIYGEGSAEEIAVTNAWYAVGVGAEYGAPASYCNSASTNVNDEYISRVQLNTIDNTSGAQFYSDFTAISTTLSTDANYTITVTPTWTGTVYSEGYAVWIDYNQDADFNDTGELVFSTGPNQNTSVSGEFTVPAGASEGETRMRVSMKYNAIPTACETFTYGEVEDYTVTIGNGGPPPPDTDPPSTPTDLSESNVTNNSFDVSWTASNDNIGVTGYNVFLNGVPDGSTAGTNYSFTGLTASTSYDVAVEAYDAAGNTSGQVAINVNTLDGGGGGTDTLHEGYFESGWDGWADGGSDSYRYTGSRSPEGNSSIRIRDNSGTASSMTLSSVDVSAYDNITIDFAFYPYSMENGEDFWVQYYDGSGWNTVETYARGTDFNNNTLYTASVNINSAQYNFASNAGFRFRCDASGNADHVYIDAVVITGSSGGGSIAENTIQEIPGNQGFGGPELTGLEIDGDEDYTIFPNPIKDMLTIQRFDDTPATYQIMSMNGKVIKSGKLSANPINVSSLKAGIYIIKIDDGEETVYRKLIKQ